MIAPLTCFTVLIRIFGISFGVFILASTTHGESLFNGTDLSGWENQTPGVWRVVDGCIVGGSLEGNPRNEFLATQSTYDHFRLSLEYRLRGVEGFINGGVQFRSQRLQEPAHEMIGYQADIGAGYSGSLYDESRRRRMLVQADSELINRIEHAGEWNRYEIHVEGKQVRLFLNGVMTVSYLEEESGIEESGKIALQIHGNCKAEIAFRNLQIEPLPSPSIPPAAVIASRIGAGQTPLPALAFNGMPYEPIEGERLVLVGQENLVMDQENGFFEAAMQPTYANTGLSLRSMAWEADTVYEQWRDLHFGPWIEQLRTVEASTILIQFGQMEALDGLERLLAFKVAYHQLLDEFCAQTRRFILVSPTPFEDPVAPLAPRLGQHNEVLRQYAEMVQTIAQERGAIFVDLFTPFADRNGDQPAMTRDGIHLNAHGLRLVGEEMARQLGASTPIRDPAVGLRDAIIHRNQLWFDAWRPANWSFAYGDRVAQRFASAAGARPSLHESFRERRGQIAELDLLIHRLARGEAVSLPELEIAGAGALSPQALSADEQLATFQMAEGFQANLFASEAQDVVNPIQIAWDGSGRLYVACSPSYPQSLASVRPSDYILVLEDEDGDGRADRFWRYAEGLTMIQGLEPHPEGIYVCDFDQLLFLRDTNGDRVADRREVLFSGFGVGDTHQLINSIAHGLDGSLWFTQGLHAMSLVETPWGIKRLDRAALWRLRPSSLLLEGFFGGGMAGANCWGVAEDDYGQVFHKTGDRPQGYWSVPGLVRGASPMGSGSRTLANQSYGASPEQYHGVGNLFDTSPKTTSLDFIGTQAMPADLQGVAVIGGYFGSLVELHQLQDDGAGYRSSQLPRILTSTDSAFRPVDVSMGPDGAIYLADWYNRVIGHYQASYADPNRDKHHGRIWRVRSTAHSPVDAPDLNGLSTAELVGYLHSPERWIRYHARRELFYRPGKEVVRALDATLNDPRWERQGMGFGQHLIEWAGLYQAHASPRSNLVARMLKAPDYRIRSYGVRTAGAWSQDLVQARGWLKRSANDEHPRVRLEAVVACSYLREPESITLALGVLDHPRDRFIDYALRQVAKALQSIWEPSYREGTLPLSNPAHGAYLAALLAEAPVLPQPGEVLYEQACQPCHQPDGEGLAGFYPSLRSSSWIEGDLSRLVRVVLHGLEGPLTINGQAFEARHGNPMPGFEGLTDEQISQLLTFLRQAFDNQAGAVSAPEVAEIRRAHAQHAGPWTQASLEP